MPTVRVPAKLNLQLAVGPLRKDGYHELVTVFHAVGLFDEVAVDAAPPNAGITIEIVGEGADALPIGPENLVHRAATAIAAEADREPDLAIRIRKEIPVAGGMAGGSADAAATLVACDALWRLGMAREELERIAASLGSDVPFALRGGTAIGTGRGERLAPVLAQGSFFWVLVFAEHGLSTPAVYAECDRLREAHAVPDPKASEALMAALRSGDAEALGRALSNDLQAAAISLRPRLAQVLELGSELGALGGIVSGSGPTCALLARDEQRALDLTVAMAASGLCRTVRRAVGPVPGAQLA